jgi:uroporphyrinogen decarboxylase
MKKPLRQPNFERLRKTLYGGQADAVPLIELGIAPPIRDAIMGHPVRTLEEEIEFMRLHGYDFVKIQPVIRFDLGRTQASVSPGRADRAWASEHGNMIETMEDFEKYPWPKSSDIDYSRLESARDKLPDGMMVIGQYGDIFTTAWELMGFENFSIAMYEEPELIDALFGKISSLIVGMYEVMAQMDWVGALWFSDDIAYSTGLMVSPDFLRAKFFPILGKISSYAKAANKPQLYHTDGLLYNVLDDIIGAGVNALHPIEPKAMRIAEVKEKAAGRLCLCGHIEVDTLCRGTTADIERLVRQASDDAAPGGGYCIGSSNSVPDYANVENYLTMIRTAAEYGKY